MIPTDKSAEPEIHKTTGHITDFVQFFTKVTDAYLEFERNLQELNRQAAQSSPQQLRKACQNLRKQKLQLEILDSQMFDIIDLAGHQISRHEKLEQYRDALSRAKTASEGLYQKLRAVRDVLQEEIDFLDVEYIF